MWPSRIETLSLRCLLWDCQECLWEPAPSMEQPPHTVYVCCSICCVFALYDWDLKVEIAFTWLCSKFAKTFFPIKRHSHMALHEPMLKQTLRANKVGQNKGKTLSSNRTWKPYIQKDTNCANVNERLNNTAKRIVCYHKRQQDEPNIRIITTHMAIRQGPATSWSTPKINHQEPVDRTPN